MNNERLPETEQGRKVIFDIHCETDKGERIIIEMQNREQPHFKDRALYYLSHSVVEQGIKGTWDYELAAVYGVFFLNFTLDEENRPNNNRNEGKFRRDIVLADRENGQVFNPKFRQIYIELPRFNKEEEECETDFERWIYVLKHMDTLDRMPFKARKAIFERLERIGSMANLTPKQRAQYEAEWKMYNDYYNTLDFAVEKGMKKGMEEGMEKGLQKGKAEGKAEGRQEEKHSIALNLKKLGVSIEQIAFATGLSIDLSPDQQLIRRKDNSHPSHPNHCSQIIVTFVRQL